MGLIANPLQSKGAKGLRVDEKPVPSFCVLVVDLFVLVVDYFVLVVLVVLPIGLAQIEELNNMFFWFYAWLSLRGRYKNQGFQVGVLFGSLEVLKNLQKTPL